MLDLHHRDFILNTINTGTTKPNTYYIDAPLISHYMPILIRFCRSGNIRKVLFFANFAKIKIMNVILIIEIEHLRILAFLKSPQITNSRKSKHAKITRSTVYG